MADPLTLEELKNVKEGTVLWGVVRQQYAIRNYQPIRKITVVRVNVRRDVIDLQGELFLSTVFRDFYTNYWDAYRAWRKMSR